MESGKIKVKALCIISRNNSGVLAGLGHDKVANEDIARIIGGTVEFGETAIEALRREFKEELGAELEEITFVEIIENIFTYNGEKGHEVTFLYTGKLADKSLYDREDLVILDAPATKVRWVSLEDIRNGKIKLYPQVNYGKIIVE